MSCMIDGRPDAPILVVGMAPGREELVADRPFVGGSGRLLWALAKRGGWTRDDCYIVNVIGEWPAKSDGNPTQDQLDRYWEAFNDAVSLFSGSVVCCLGGVAFDRLTGIVGANRKAKLRTGIEAWRGYLVSKDECFPHTRRVIRYEQYKTTTKLHKKGDPKVVKHRVVEVVPLSASVRWIIPSLHPAAVLRTGYRSIPALAADLARVGRAVHDELHISDVAYSSTPSVGTNGDVVAIDIETRREANTDIIVRIGSASERGTWTRHWDNLARVGAESELNNPFKLKALHNMQYDIPRLDSEGIQMRGPWWDTMLASTVLQPDLPKGLNSVASLVLDTPRWKHLSDDEPEKYNAWDAQRTREICLYQQVELKRTGQYEWFVNGMMPALPVLMDMTKRGIRMDDARRIEWLAELSAKEQELEARWQIVSGGAHPGSPKQVANYLYGGLGLPVQYGKEGGQTTNVEALTALVSWASGRPDAEQQRVLPVLNALLRYREVSKLRSTYTEHPLGDDGCIHPSYLPAAKDDDDKEFGKGLAGTGRITSRDPNVQNQPKEARKLFVPHSADLILVEADYSQIELRIAAALSGDRALQEALKGDVHARTQQLLNCDRVRAKNVMYGTIYGAGPRKLAKVLRAKGFPLTEIEARELQDALAKAYPALWAWRQHVVNEVAKTYHLTTPHGQRRYFFQGKKDAPAAIDFLPQATAAGITWKILPKLAQALAAFNAALLTLVHDSTLNEALRKRLAETVKVLKGEMECEWPEIAPGFRVPVEVKVGENWGEMQPWKD